MKIAIYCPDSFHDLAIDVRVSIPKGSDSGVAWFCVKEPKDVHPNEVEVVIEDED